MSVYTCGFSLLDAVGGADLRLGVLDFGASIFLVLEFRAVIAFLTSYFFQTLNLKKRETKRISMILEEF